MDETVECSDAAGLAAAQALIPTASDLCDSDVSDIVKTSGSFVAGATCPQAGTYTNTWVVTDDCGNTSAVFTQVITIEDTMAPDVVDGSDLTVECDGAGNTQQLDDWLDTQAGGSATDLCGAVTWSNNFVEMSDGCGATGTTIAGEAITLTAIVRTDNFSNETSWTLSSSISGVIATGGLYNGTTDDNQEFITELVLDTPDGITETFSLTIEDTFGDGTNSPPFGSPVVCSEILINGVQQDEVCDNFGASATIAAVHVGVPPTIMEGPVTFTATDECGNSASFDATFTIEDTTPPEFVTPLNNVDQSYPTNVAGCQLFVPFQNEMATDMCSDDADVVITIAAVDFEGTPLNVFNANTPTPSATFNVGVNTVTFTATDDCGNSRDTSFTVTITDGASPTIECPDPLTAVCDISEIAPYADFDEFKGDGGAAQDNCLLDESSFTYMRDDLVVDDCPNGKEYQRWYSISDAVGNIDSCFQTIIVNDDVKPMFATQPGDVTIECTASTLAADNGGFPTATDNCSAVTIDSVDVIDLSGCGGYTGTITRTWTATDECGNADSYDQIITIEDTTAPVAMCQDFTVQLDVNGNATITPSDIDNGSADACGTVSLSLDVTSFDCSNVGSNTVTLTVTDPCGNASMCMATVTVEDTEAPEAVCQNITVQLDASGNVEITAADVDGGSSDNCPDFTVSIDVNSFDCSNVGPNDVVLTITDVQGLSDQCTAVVTVEDNIAPTITCPGDMTVSLGANCLYELADFTGMATTVENCTATVTQSPEAGAINTYTEEQTITVTLTVDDGNGNLDECMFDVFIDDDQAVQIACPADQIVELDVNCEASMPDFTGMATVTDGCDAPGTILVTQSPAVGSPLSGVGVTPVTLSYDDGNGNTADCTFNVTTDDVTPPMIDCPGDVTVALDGSCEAVLADYTGDATTSDECSTNITVTQSPTIGDPISGPQTIVVTLTADDGNGNTEDCTFNVVVQDQAPPTAVCAYITVELDVNGMYTLTAQDSMDIVGGSSDNCGVDFTSIAQTSFDCTDLGENMIDVTVTDVNGLSSMCQATITVEDNIAPVITSCPMDVTFSAPQTLCFVDNETINIADVSDNCTAYGDLTATVSGVLVSNNDPITVNIASDGGTGYDITGTFPVGENEITVEIEDENGQINVCQFTIQVNDVFAPIINDCPSDIIVTAPNGDCEIAVTWGDPTVSDFCPDFSFSSNIPSGTVFEVGTTTEIVYTAVDASGNESECRFDVTVNGNCDPDPADLQIDYLQPVNTIYNVGDVRDVVISISEVAGTNTSGTTQIFIAPVGGFSLAFDDTQTSAATLLPPFSITVNNGDWVAVPQGSGFILSSNTMIPANSTTRIAMSFTANDAGTATASNAIIIPGSGGDSNASNNGAFISVSINN